MCWTGRKLMKPIARSLLAIFAAAVFGGCAQSYHPFYMEKSKVKVPELIGEWQKADETNVPPWVCTETKPLEYLVQTSDDKGNVSPVTVVPFKIGTNLFCDVTASDKFEAAEKINAYLKFTVIPVHYVCKLEIRGDTVAVTALQYDWLKSKIESAAIKLPAIHGEEKDRLLFTATSEEWETFLAKYGNDPEAFKTENAMTFKRRPAPTPTLKP
jgi:hypothetical protein